MKIKNQIQEASKHLKSRFPLSSTLQAAALAPLLLSGVSARADVREVEQSEHRQQVERFYDAVPQVRAADCAPGQYWVTDPGGGIARCVYPPPPPYVAPEPPYYEPPSYLTPPTAAPTAAPTQGPTVSPTAPPTQGPTVAPTAAPTQGPTAAPTAAPTAEPYDPGPPFFSESGGWVPAPGEGEGEGDGSSSGDGSAGGCFLTTATVEALGLPDDCKALTLARYLRDNKMTSTHDSASVRLYYQVAPVVVSRSSPDEWIRFWKNDMRRITRLIELEQYELARDLYTLATARLINKKATRVEDRELVDAVYAYGLKDFGKSVLPYRVRHALLKASFVAGLGYQSLRLGIATRRFKRELSI